MKYTYKAISFALVTVLFFSSCSKTEGKGGTSSIQGEVNGASFLGNSINPAENELTTVICAHADGVGGSILDNSDYFLLNTPTGGVLYYVWYENTNWLGQDPGLSGRTGVKVTYSNNESNVTIANNTMTAINAVAGIDFTASVDADVVTIENNDPGGVVDADDVNTPFVIDTQNQGKTETYDNDYQADGPVVDERVYIIYDEEDFYSEAVRTDENGNYQFKGLTKGDYLVFAFSLDTVSTGGLLHQVEVSASIEKNKTVIEAPTLTIVKQ
jgi:energy-converting hydrogenase Eha subunit B